MKSRKKPSTLSEYLAIRKKMITGSTDYTTQRYRKSLKAAMGISDKGEKELKFIEDNDISIGKYSLRTRIRKNPWLVKGRPAAGAIKWLFSEVFKDPRTYHYRKLNMGVGQLFTFEYKNPKFKGTKQLPWFDKYPLVLSLGPIVTNNGIRNLGFNLHLLPPKIRIIVLVKVFEIYKRYYRYQIFFGREKPVQINYKVITKTLAPYGANFAVRMYIPRRQRVVILFPYRDWHKAIFIPSRGYDSIKAYKLISEWTKYIRKLGYATSPKTDWNSKI